MDTKFSSIDTRYQRPDNSVPAAVHVSARPNVRGRGPMQFYAGLRSVPHRQRRPRVQMLFVRVRDRGQRRWDPLHGMSTWATTQRGQH
jgi:hypothetical protein